MICGSFKADESHAELRQRLDGRTLLPSPDWLQPVRADVAELPQALASQRNLLDHFGVAAVVVDRPLKTAEFLGLAAQWGDPVPEHADATQSFVEEAVVLNMWAKWGATADIDRQPFSASPITLHSEGSRRPVASQPRFLLFSCLRGAPDGSGGQTVLVRMQDVLARIEDRDQELLAVVTYRAEGCPPLLRIVGHHKVISCRDFQHEALDWQSTADVAPERVNRALGNLVRAMYDPKILFGLTWPGPMIVVLDNFRVLHGRTAITNLGLQQERRRLQRIRVVSRP